MVQLCYLCKNGEIVVDKKMSSSYCTGCGECFDLGAFTDEVQFREDDKGRFTSVGTAFHVDKGFVNWYVFVGGGHLVVLMIMFGVPQQQVQHPHPILGLGRQCKGDPQALLRKTFHFRILFANIFRLL